MALISRDMHCKHLIIAVLFFPGLSVVLLWESSAVMTDCGKGSAHDYLCFRDFLLSFLLIQSFSPKWYCLVSVRLFY